MAEQKFLQIIFPISIPDLHLLGMSVDGSLFFWLVVLALVAGIYTTYGGMSSMIYTAAAQFCVDLRVRVRGSSISAISGCPNGWEGRPYGTIPADSI